MCTHQNNYVLDSRNNEFGIRRRRECADCGHRWSTIEIAFDDNVRGQDPWAEYRRQAIKRWLKKQLNNRDLQTDD